MDILSIQYFSSIKILADILKPDNVYQSNSTELKSKSSSVESISHFFIFIDLSIIDKYYIIIMNPSYLKISPAAWSDRLGRLYSILESCALCPRQCGVNRLKGETGFCRSGSELIISSIGPHFGEERPLVGRGGSGTVFLTNCNLGCIYCQNYDISHLGYGKKMTAQQLANRMTDLQIMGCRNINFVTPTHFVPQIAESIKLAAENGLSVPIVYNCGGYESPETIKLLNGIVDIYMPDIKYSDDSVAKKYSDAPDYFKMCTESVKEMFRQTGDLLIEDGIAKKGLLIRHLVLPNGLAGTQKVMEFISRDLSKETYVNIMFQYHPQYHAQMYSELRRSPLKSEFDEAVNIAVKAGLHRGFTSPFC